MGPGLLESVYETCLCHELKLRGVHFERQVIIPLHYKDLNLDSTFRIDLLVEKVVIVELKAIEKVEPVHLAQLLTYLRLEKLWLGLLLNFNVPVLKEGVFRVVNG